MRATWNNNLDSLRCERSLFRSYEHEGRRSVRVLKSIKETFPYTYVLFWHRVSRVLLFIKHLLRTSSRRASRGRPAAMPLSRSHYFALVVAAGVALFLWFNRNVWSNQGVLGTTGRRVQGPDKCYFFVKARYFFYETIRQISCNKSVCRGCL